MSMLEEFRRHLPTLGLHPGRALVAVSGGPDSVALLDLLARTGDLHRLELGVGHIDHGIQPDSAVVAGRVEALAAHYGLACETGSLGLGPGASETASRVARYAWLETVRARIGADYVFTAHHADDQAETVLMRVLGGTGPAGLAAMAARAGCLVRPLLPFRRVELVRHLSEAGLAEAGHSAWLDPANADPRHLRSWLRIGVLPAIRDRIPQADARLVRVARQAGRDRAAWDTLLDVLPGLDCRDEADGISVAATLLRRYDSPLAEALVMAAARRAGKSIGERAAQRVSALVRAGVSGASTPLGRGWKAELAFDRLRLVPADEGGAPAPWTLSGPAGERAWGRWRFHWAVEPAPVRQPRLGGTAWFVPGSLTVRGWRPGEWIRPLGGAGGRLLVRCFQDARVPRGRRPGWPVVVEGERVVWVPDVCRSDTLIPTEGTEALRVDAGFA